MKKILLSLISASLITASLSSAAFAGAYDDFFTAAKNDNAKVMASLLQRGLDPNIIEESRGDTGLIIALREDSMKVIDILIAAPGIDLEATAKNGDNALMLAAFKGNKQAVEKMLAKGARVNRPNWTALHYAATSGSNDIVQLLINKGADLNARSPNGTTPLMMAAGEGYILTVKLLLDNGADATLRNELGLNAIDFAANGGYKDIVEGLTVRLKKAGKL